MCLKPLEIYTNSRFVSKYHTKPFLVNVPCGQCSECRRQKKSQWRVRAYYEAKETYQNKDNFVLFDTLTYNETQVPHLSDKILIPVDSELNTYIFNRKHIQNFMKLLRRYLSTDGYDVKDKLRYFLTSEYGKKNTHRPHYHVLFFSRVPGLAPEVLSRYIAICWPYGITDGVLFKGYDYVKNNRVFRGDDALSLNVFGYVSKYVTKDIEFDKDIKSRLRKFMDIVSPGWNDVYNGRLTFRRLLGQCQEFHLQSKGFGLFALKDNSIETLLRNNSISIPVSGKKVLVNVPLPIYYKHKLLYRQNWFNGKSYWCPTELGLQNMADVDKKSVYNAVARFADILGNLNFIQSIDSTKTALQIKKLLDGRSLNQFADYLLHWRGRIISPLSDWRDCYTPSAFNMVQLVRTGSVWYCYNTAKVVSRFKWPFVSDTYVIDDLFGMSNITINHLGQIVKSETFVKKYCYNENSKPEFRNFDKLLELFNYLQSIRNDVIDEKSNQNEITVKHFKEIGLLRLKK